MKAPLKSRFDEKMQKHVQLAIRSGYKFASAVFSHKEEMHSQTITYILQCVSIILEGFRKRQHGNLNISYMHISIRYIITSLLYTS